VWIVRAPDSFHALCARPAMAYFGAPVEVVQKLFYGFKGIQLAVFSVGAICLGIDRPHRFVEAFLPSGSGVPCSSLGKCST
jgi:hypothetical protein